MPTKPIAESGWTKQFPTTDGDYLCRINEDDLSPVSFRLENGAIYEYGCGKNLRSDYHHHAAGYEFLGPFTASDFEQLIRLRDLLRQCLPYVLSAAEAAKMMDGFHPREHKEHRLAAAILDAVDDDGIRAALREALTLKGEQS